MASSARVTTTGPPAGGSLPGVLDETQVRAMFDRIAGVYDRMNSVMTAGLHHQWRRRAGELAARRLEDGRFAGHRDARVDSDRQRHRQIERRADGQRELPRCIPESFEMDLDFVRADLQIR